MISPGFGSRGQRQVSSCINICTPRAWRKYARSNWLPYYQSEDDAIYRLLISFWLPRQKRPQDRACLSTFVHRISSLPLVHSKLVWGFFLRNKKRKKETKYNLRGTCYVTSAACCPAIGLKTTYYEILSPAVKSAKNANPNPHLHNCSELFSSSDFMISCALFNLWSQYLKSAEALRREASKRW